MTVLVGRWRMRGGAGGDTADGSASAADASSSAADASASAVSAADTGELDRLDLTVTADPAPGIAAWAVTHPAAGVYEADRTYPGPGILKFDEHLDRFEASARCEGFPLTVDRAGFRRVLRELGDRALREIGGFGSPLPGNSPHDSSLPADTSRGSVRFLVRAPQLRPGELEIVIEPFRPPAPELYESGVVCATMPGARRAHPEAKTSGWMSERQAFALPPGTYEGLLVSEADEILEGATSNFYAVLDGELRTAEADVLLGIARQIVVEVAPEILPLRREPIRRGDLPRVSEAFLTSSSRAVLPIRSIDGVLLGARGPWTDRIARAYDAWVNAHLAPL